jgi:hypothetical protein
MQCLACRNDRRPPGNYPLHSLTREQSNGCVSSIIQIRSHGRGSLLPVLFRFCRLCLKRDLFRANRLSRGVG